MNLNALILGIAVIALTLFGITQGSELSKSEFGQKVHLTSIKPALLGNIFSL